MKEVSIYIVTGIRGRWQQDGHIGYALEYYKENWQVPGGDKGSCTGATDE